MLKVVTSGPFVVNGGVAAAAQQNTMQVHHQQLNITGELGGLYGKQTQVFGRPYSRNGSQQRRVGVEKF